MSKLKTAFYCTECGGKSSKWLGRCTECGSWNSLVEESTSAVVVAEIPGRRAASINAIESSETPRFSTRIADLDRVLGGGVVPGSIVLVGGEPGIGKSTLLTQVAGELAKSDQKVLYISGEESAKQVRLRAERLGEMHDNFLLANTNELNEALSFFAGEKPSVAIIDSIQTLHSSEMDSTPGGVSQIRHCATTIQNLAKRTDTAVFLVGHVTKDGNLAGPKILEHLVDTVLYFEGEGFGRMRALRAVKNRFGSVDEIAVFDMTERGLEPVENPSAAMLAERKTDSAGSVVFPAIEGSRALLVEIQALVTPNYNNNPRRAITGLDHNRVSQVIGVLEKRGGLRLGGHDIFVNLVGGLQIREPAADLAVMLAIASSHSDKPLPDDIVAFGEIGLTGEIRSVPAGELRLKEAARNGFRRAAVSQSLKRTYKVEGINAGGFRSVEDSLALLNP